jgi:deoxyribodipyrimidine photo-lyase
MSTAPTLLWFRKDLRIADNSALAAAIDSGALVIPVFIWSPNEMGHWSSGAASKWWLHQALASLSGEFRKLGGELILRRGDAPQVLEELIAETGATRVFWNRRYEAPLRTIDAGIKRQLRERSIDVQSFNSSLLNEPHTVAAGGGQPYKVYTPYWKKVKDRMLEPVAVPAIEALQFPNVFPRSDGLESFELMPKLNWDAGFFDRWDVSEAGALQRLNAFVAGPIGNYHVDRDRPDHEGTSSLAPYLQWGQVGPRQIVQAVSTQCDLAAEGPQVYLKEIYWREFAYNVLYHFPNTPDRPLRLEYEKFPWQTDAATLKAWRTGHTGYPIVDAGMRQLWQTGWMHNRVRMIVSSLLVKHLLQDWQDGARWFWDTLVDADLASNTLGWQWSGGCGADAAPYFRVFNPIIQGKKFDPDGDYVKRYVPELSGLDSEYIHEPWEAPRSVLYKAGIEMGVTYPKPIIEHKAGRERALSALAQFKG